MTAVRRTLTWAALGTLLLVWASCGDGHRGVGGFDAPPVPEPTYRFGVVWDSLVVDSGLVKSGQSLSHLLDPAGIGPGKVATLAANSRPTYDVRNMRAGREWWLASLPVRDSLGRHVGLTPQWFIYERNPKDYAVFSLADTLGVKLGSYPVDTVYARAVGSIESSLYLDLEKGGHPTNLAVSMANVYAWTIDFSRVQPGDAFDVLYRRETVNGEPVGMPEVLASRFTHWDAEKEAYLFNQGDGNDYFDLEGGSLRKAFLKAPVEFSRISSRFNPKRFHPVLKR